MGNEGSSVKEDTLAAPRLVVYRESLAKGRQIRLLVPVFRYGDKA